MVLAAHKGVIVTGFTLMAVITFLENATVRKDGMVSFFFTSATADVFVI